MNYTPLSIGDTFPTAADVRKHKSKSQKRFEELEVETATFIKDTLRVIIFAAQENDCAGSTCRHTVSFRYPAFVKAYEECEQFVGMMKATLQRLGYSVYGETDGEQEPTQNVIVSWKEVG